VNRGWLRAADAGRQHAPARSPGASGRPLNFTSLGGATMNKRYAISTCLFLFSTHTPCAEEPGTVADFAVQGVLSRIRVYADFCTAEVPSLGSDSKALMRGLNTRGSRDCEASTRFIRE
jgi:hypothetical protein